MKPSDIARIVITQIEHNSSTETDNNWNIDSVAVSMSNVGGPQYALFNFSGAPLARLTGTLPSVTLPPPTAAAGLGMTMPIDAPEELADLNLNPNLPNGELPFGYQVPPSEFVDQDKTSMLTGSCDSSWKGCLPAWKGQVKEQDGRLNPFLRANAASHDARLLLGRAVWLRLNQSLPGKVKRLDCGSDNVHCSTALAQLAVTGREAFNSFVGWNPTFGPASSGPQVQDLMQLVRQGRGEDLPAIPPTITNTDLEEACTNALTDGYTALWAIRSNQLNWRQYRLNTGWIAVSGEDDAPHRPVNVFTAPFPQFDVDVPVMVGGRAFTLRTRYMIAAGKTFMDIAPGKAPTRAPAISLVSVGGNQRLAIPDDSPTTLLDGTLFDKNVIVYIHGGGSRLEEAFPMAKNFLTNFGAWSDNLIVISLDLPNSAYDDPMVTAVDNGQRIALDASSSAFENGPNGTFPRNINNFPVLNFTLNFINNFISKLNDQKIINAN